MIVSHDVEFCADYATDCALLFDGNLIGADAANSFLRTIIFIRLPYSGCLPTKRRMRDAKGTGCFVSEKI